MSPIRIRGRSPFLLVKRRGRFEALLHKRRCIGSGSSTNTSSDAASANAADDVFTVDGAETESTLSAQCVQPRPIFPWRSSHDPLPRLTQPLKPSIIKHATDDDEIEENKSILGEYYGSDYFTKGGPLGPGWISPMEPWFRGILYAACMNFLGVSWPSIIMPWTRRDWEHEMTSNFCHAFSNGVQGMIENTYMISEKQGDSVKVEAAKQCDGSESFDVNLDITMDPLPLAKRNRDSDTNNDEGSNNKINRDISREHEEFEMLQRNLRQLYLNARKHSYPSKVNIVLRSVPQSAQIESMFPVFGLSRSLVENHPNLRHTYHNLMKDLERKTKEALRAGNKELSTIEQKKFFMESLTQVLERSAKLSGDGHASVTIVAQVSINCKEVFFVRDVETGDILQGDGDCHPRDVTHLVRFEMVVRESYDPVDEVDDGGRKMQIGRWQISDWDDILDGNIFFI